MHNVTTLPHLIDLINPKMGEKLSLIYNNATKLGSFVALTAALLCLDPLSAAAQTQANGANPVAAQRGSKAPSYRLPGSDRHAYNYDAKPQIQGYAQIVWDSYSASLADAQRLRTAIEAFLANPNDDTLSHARNAWINARRTWEQTEAFRFYDGPIDVADIETKEPGREGQLDGWPIDPAAIDQVEGNPTSGIINDMKLAMTRRTLLDRQKAAQGRAVTTGWHAIEFLLWGEPQYAGVPGDRPPTDYLAGQPNNDRRRAYLKLTTDLLIEDIRYLVDSWLPKSAGNYAHTFQLINQREALGRLLNGIALLAGNELATKRLAAALDGGNPKAVTSRFSAASYDDFVFALRGIRNVWIGDYGDDSQPSLALLMQRVDPILAQRILHALNHAEAAIAALQTPLERETLPAPSNAPARQAAERAIADLKQLAGLIREAGAKLGVAVNLPT